MIEDTEQRPLWQRLLLYLVLSVLIILLFMPSLFLTWNKSLYASIGFSFLMFLLIPGGANLINAYLDRAMPWNTGHKRRFYVSLFIIIVYSIIVAGLLSVCFSVLFWGYSLQSLSLKDLYGSFLITTLVTTIASLFAFSINFLNNWQALAEELEQRKNKALYAQIETLQNQIKPHFLFNNLNAITSIIPKQPEVAIKFVHQLANVYRYILDHQQDEVVSLDTEMNFAESYCFLLKIRFGDKLKINWDIPNTIGKLPPYVLQLLLENAVKHNIISKHKPLIISIKRQNNTIVVSNNLQIKQAEGVSWGIGLNNIKSRYQLLSDQAIKVLNTEHQFSVELPILQS